MVSGRWLTFTPCLWLTQVGYPGCQRPNAGELVSPPVEQLLLGDRGHRQRPVVDLVEQHGDPVRLAADHHTTAPLPVLDRLRDREARRASRYRRCRAHPEVIA
jgi:hypothetical protein